MINSPFRVLASTFLFVAVLAQDAAAQLVQNGYFTSLSYSGSPALTTLYGQFGTGTGSTLTLANWSTTGYNFVYAPNTADAGDKNGASAGQPKEAPGQYNSGNYGNTYLWGSNNGGLVTLPSTDPAGGNFVAADGAFQTGPISQTINGLDVGRVYNLTFYWAAAQQQGYTGDTTSKWSATLGGQMFYTTPTYSLKSGSFSGWMQQTFSYVASSATEALSFLAVGTPTGQPPFALLGGVSINPAPEPSSWVFFIGFGGACLGMGMVRRRRRRQVSGGADRPGA